jgi:hypothetical protein
VVADHCGWPKAHQVMIEPSLLRTLAIDTLVDAAIWESRSFFCKEAMAAKPRAQCPKISYSAGSSNRNHSLLVRN